MKEEKVTKYTGGSVPVTYFKTGSVNNTAPQLWSITQWLKKIKPTQLMTQRVIQKNQKSTQRPQREAGALQSTNDESRFCYNEAHTVL